MIKRPSKILMTANTTFGGGGGKIYPLSVFNAVLIWQELFLSSLILSLIYKQTIAKNLGVVRITGSAPIFGSVAAFKKWPKKRF